MAQEEIEITLKWKKKEEQELGALVDFVCWPPPTDLKQPSLLRPTRYTHTRPRLQEKENRRDLSEEEEEEEEEDSPGEAFFL